MAADGSDDGAGADPAVVGFVRVIVIDRAAGGVPTVCRVLCRFQAGAWHRGCGKLSIGHTGERASLIDHARNGVGEGRMAYAV